MPGWGFARQWDQPTIAGHSSITCDTIDECLVVRVYDPSDPDLEVARVSLDPSAARKLGAQLLLGAAAAEWEYSSRALEALLRARATSSPTPPAEPEPEPDEPDPEPELQLARCPVCGDRAQSTEDQPVAGEVQWLARCGARWATRGDRVREITLCGARTDHDRSRAR